MNKFVEWLFGSSLPSGGPSASWSLKFTADYGPYVSLLILAVLAFLVWLTIRSYRREGKHRPLVKYGLAAVRLAIVVLCVGILFRPAAVLSNQRVLHSAVIVLVDDSQSMTIKDQYASDAGYLKGLGEMLHVDPTKLADKSRLDIVREALVKQGGAIARLAQEHPIRLMKFSPGTAKNAKDVNSLGVVEAMRAEDVPAKKDAPVPQSFKELLDGLKGEGYSTNLASGIRGTLETAQGQRVAGLVVISDGRQTTEDAGNRLHHALEYAQARGISIYSVAVGDPTPTKNVAVLGLQAPRDMRKGAKVEMTVKVAHRNMDRQQVTVKLFRTKMEGGEATTMPSTAPAAGPVKNNGVEEKWQDTGVKADLILAADDAKGQAQVQDAVLKIDPVPNELGNYKYKAVIEPLAQEFNKDDNESTPVQVQIVDSMVNVLLVAGDSGWEFQYLRNLIQRQPDLYRISVWQQNAEKGVSQSSSTPELKLETMPRTMNELVYNPQTRKGYHVIILYDPEYTQNGFDKEFCKNLKEYLKQGKGGVLYIAGNKYTNDNLVLKDKAVRDLQDILPVELAPNMTMMDLLTKEPEPWRVSLTLAGREHQITRLGNSAEDTEKIWGSNKIAGILPGIFWSHPVAKVKPLAHVLLENTNPRAASGGAMEPLLAVQMYDKSPVVYLGTDDTWRWRFVEDSTYYKQFWNNLLSFLSTSKATRVTITTGGDRFTIDKPVTVDVEAYDGNFKPEKAKTYTVEVWDIAGKLPVKVSDLTLNQAIETVMADVPGSKEPKVESHAKPGRYTGQFEPPHVGKYEIRVAVKEICQPKQIEVTMKGDEFLRTETDEETMKTLVRDKADRFMRISAIDNLSEMIPPSRIISIEQKSHELWDIPLLLIVLLVLFVAEWILRKKYNMA